MVERPFQRRKPRKKEEAMDVEHTLLREKGQDLLSVNPKTIQSLKERLRQRRQLERTQTSFIIPPESPERSWCDRCAEPHTRRQKARSKTDVRFCRS